MTARPRKEPPRHYLHTAGTCPELLDPDRFGGLWSRGPYFCNRPIDRLGRCKRHATAEERRAAKWHGTPEHLAQPHASRQAPTKESRP